jgi:hypothetical protein
MQRLCRYRALDPASHYGVKTSGKLRASPTPSPNADHFLPPLVCLLLNLQAQFFFSYFLCGADMFFVGFMFYLLLSYFPKGFHYLP